MKKSLKGVGVFALAAQPLLMAANERSNLASAVSISSVLGACKSAWHFFKECKSYTDEFVHNARDYYAFFWLLSDIKDWAADKYYWFHNKAFASTYRKRKDVIKWLRKGFKLIKGQKDAKRQVEKFALKLSSEKEEAELNGRKRQTADIVLLAGTSGCGKSMMARALARAISTANAFVVSAGDVDHKSSTPVVSQLFGKRSSAASYESNKYEKATEKNCLISYIENVKHGVVIIDEFDKLDPSGELTELLRSFIDNGYGYVNGHKIDASNITFILTSNEKIAKKAKDKPAALPAGSKTDDGSSKTQDLPSSTTGETAAPTAASETIEVATNLEKPKEEKAPGEGETPNDAPNAAGTATEEKPEDDSRTNVVRDKSFMNRVTIIEFEDLTEQDYAEIVKSEYGESMPKYWKKVADIDLDLSRVYKPVGKKASTMDEHGRAVRKIMSNLIYKISERLGSAEGGKRDIRGKKVIAVYDGDKDEFDLIIK